MCFRFPWLVPSVGLFGNCFEDFMKLFSVIFVSMFLFGCASSQHVDNIQSQVNRVGGLSKSNQETLRRFANNVANNEVEQQKQMNVLEQKLKSTQKAVDILEDKVSRMNGILDKKFVSNASK